MSTQDKGEARLKSLIVGDEKLLRTGNGQDGRHDVFFALTNRRLIIFRMGATRFSDPTMAEISLDDVRTVDCQRGILGAGPTLSLDSRSGQFSFMLTKQARREGGHWPNWILDAQRGTQRSAAHSESDEISSGLARIAALRDSGALTSEEFTAAKAKLLGTS